MLQFTIPSLRQQSKLDRPQLGSDSQGMHTYMDDSLPSPSGDGVDTNPGKALGAFGIVNSGIASKFSQVGHCLPPNSSFSFSCFSSFFSSSACYCSMAICVCCHPA